MHVDLLTLILLMVVGFGAAFIDSIAGGSGLIMVTAYLTAGIPPHLTLGTNKFAATMGVGTAVWAYVRKGFLKPKLWMAATVAALLGSGLGAITIHFFSAQFLQLFLPAVVLIIAIYALWPKPKNKQENNHLYKPSKFSSAVIGSIIGFYDGFFGPGTGSFWTSALMYFYNMDIRAASAVARFMNFISNLIALVTFCVFGNVDYILGLCVGGSMIVGSYLGAHSAMKYGTNFIKPIFATVVVILSIRLIYLEWL